MQVNQNSTEHHFECKKKKNPLLKASTCCPGWHILHDDPPLFFDVVDVDKWTFGACCHFSEQLTKQTWVSS